MGNSSSAVPGIDLYEEHTCLDKRDIQRAYAQFNSIAKRCKRDRHNGDVKLLIKDVKKSIPQLSGNPLGTRICRIFSHDGIHLDFVDYLEMIAAFSRKADRQTKLDIAFLLYDFDNDNVIGKNDLVRACFKMANDRTLLQGADNGQEKFVQIADMALRESDLDGDHALSKFEFEQILGTVPNFYELFRFEAQVSFSN